MSTKNKAAVLSINKNSKLANACLYGNANCEEIHANGASMLADIRKGTLDLDRAKQANTTLGHMTKAANVVVQRMHAKNNTEKLAVLLAAQERENPGQTGLVVTVATALDQRDASAVNKLGKTA